MGGAEEILAIIKANIVALALATGSPAKTFKLKSASHPGIFSAFQTIVVGDDPDVKSGKPAPDIFIVAAHRLGLPNEELKNCLVIEDSPNGVQGALAAGMHVAWIPDPSLNLAEYPSLVQNPSVHLYQSLHQLATDLPNMLLH